MPGRSVSFIVPIEVRAGQAVGAILERPEARAERVPALVAEHGALLIRGCSEADFLNLTASWGESFVVHPSPQRDQGGADDTIKTVDRGHHAIPLHAELAYAPTRPDVIAFFCVRPAERGGETTIADGRAFAKAMTRAAIELFKQDKLVFAHRVPSAIWRPQLERLQAAGGAIPGGLRSVRVVEEHGDQVLLTEFVTSALVGVGSGLAFANSILTSLPSSRDPLVEATTSLSLSSGRSIPEEIQAELWEIAERVSVAVPWRRGDLILLDNWRFMHGRRAFEGERAILTRFIKRPTVAPTT